MKMTYISREHQLRWWGENDDPKKKKKNVILESAEAYKGSLNVSLFAVQL